MCVLHFKLSHLNSRHFSYLRIKPEKYLCLGVTGIFWWGSVLYFSLFNPNTWGACPRYQLQQQMSHIFNLNALFWRPGHARVLSGCCCPWLIPFVHFFAFHLETSNASSFQPSFHFQFSSHLASLSLEPLWDSESRSTHTQILEPSSLPLPTSLSKLHSM